MTQIKVWLAKWWICMLTLLTTLTPKTVSPTKSVSWINLRGSVSISPSTIDYSHLVWPIDRFYRCTYLTISHRKFGWTFPRYSYFEVGHSRRTEVWAILRHSHNIRTILLDYNCMQLLWSFIWEPNFTSHWDGQMTMTQLSLDTVTNSACQAQNIRPYLSTYWTSNQYNQPNLNWFSKRFESISVIRE